MQRRKSGIRNRAFHHATLLDPHALQMGNTVGTAGTRKCLRAQMAELKKSKDDNHLGGGPDAWVFPGKRNRPLDMGWLMSEHIKPIAAKLGIRRIHWYAIRHLNNSLMMNEGVDVATRMDRLGTSRIELT